MKQIVALILLVCSLYTHGFGQIPLSEKMTQTAIDKLFKDSVFVNNTKGPKWTYDMGVVLEGVAETWKNTGNSSYFSYIESWMDKFVGQDGTIKNYSAKDFNIDHIKNGRTLLLLYKVTKKEKYLKACHTLYKQLLNHPRTKEGGYWHKKIYPNQMWLDGLYMAQPFRAEYAALMNLTDEYNDIANQFFWMEKNAKDQKTGLLYHGWDESRAEKWANAKTGQSPNFWARGMGWYVMGLVDVLDYFPLENANRQPLIDLLNRTLKTIVKYQDPKTGVWFDVMDRGDIKENYVEASASSMFVYALAKSIRLGYVSKGYAKNTQKAYEGLLKEFISTSPNGQINLNHVVEVSGLGGKKKYRDGSFEYYMSEPVVSNDPKGVGPFILAASEMEIFQEQPKGKQLTVTLDNYFNNEYKADPTGKLKPYHYLWDGDDNNGFSFWGRIFNRKHIQTNTLKTAPNLSNLRQSNIYIIVDPDTEKETEQPHMMTEQSASEIANWVKKGGVLVLLLNDVGNCEIKEFNTLATKFGITFNEDSKNRVKNNNYEEGAVYVPKGTGIFHDVNKIYVKEISTLSLKYPAKELVKHHDDIIMATASFGKGTVFAIGDPWLYNEYVDGRKLPKDFQNFQAAEELTTWLISKIKN